MTRKTFLKSVARQLAQLWESPVAGLFSLLDATESEKRSEEDRVLLFEKAMRLGIDPASFDDRQLRGIIAQQGVDDASKRSVPQ